MALQTMHGGTKRLKLLRADGINHHCTVVRECLQPGEQSPETIGCMIRLVPTADCRGPVEHLPLQTQHRISRDRAITFLLEPGIEMAGAKPEAAIAGKRCGVHRLTVQQMHPLNGGTSPRQKGRHVQSGVHRSIATAELLGQNLGFKHPMTAQGGIAATHHQQLVATDPFGGKGLRQGGHDRSVALGRSFRWQSAGVGQHEQQG